ncbi:MULTISPECIES: LysR family transcriptional regulator [Methylobacterium]|uniref:LysR family transcriptional regulator n=1 Tax=Methylobacterium TaxID=407 RepID=UPI0028ADC55D|nr:LysR family transcriptional regulator [Methylobacterium sp. DB0501]
MNRLDLKTLRLFAAICEDGTLNGAARRAAIAPSAVSKRLAELEQALGCVLLTREPRGMRPTPAGETLLHHTRRMLASAEQIALELAEHAKGVRGIVRMLANLSAIVQFLPEDLRTFLARQAAIKIDLEERPSGGVIRGVAEGAGEIGICSRTVATLDLHATLYRRDRLVLVMRQEHPLAGRTQIAFADALGYDFIGLHAQSSIYDSVRAEAQRIGRPLRLRVHVPGFDAVCRMVQADMGLGVIPAQVFGLIGGAMQLAAVPLVDPWAARELILVTRPGSLSPAASLLVAHLTQASGS